MHFRHEGEWYGSACAPAMPSCMLRKSVVRGGGGWFAGVFEGAGKGDGVEGGTGTPPFWAGLTFAGGGGANVNRPLVV